LNTYGYSDVSTTVDANARLRTVPHQMTLPSRNVETTEVKIIVEW
jgi:hypothetical protein